MLNIFIDDSKGNLPKGYISYVTQYFDNHFEPEWFADEYVRHIIQEIDNSEVVGIGKGVNIYNEILGNIPPQYLSSGCKSLILLHICTDVKVNGDRMGDNCLPILLDIAGRKDITVSFSRMPKFPDTFQARILNSGKIVVNRADFVREKLAVQYD
jgi:hypothetical protein